MADVDVKDRRDTRTGAGISFYGVHHLALNTDDMKMTVDFYQDILGFRLVHAMKVPPGLGTGPGNRGNPPFEEVRHYFFDMGRDGLLAFFEMPKGAKERGDRNALGAMQHVSFAVSPESQKRMCAQLKAANVPFDGPMEILPGIFSIYVFDPNDIRLEFSCQPSNGEGEPEIVPLVTQTKNEALKELKSLTGDKGLARQGGRGIAGVDGALARPSAVMRRQLGHRASRETGSPWFAGRCWSVVASLRDMTTPHNSLPVAIAGGGIGGLATARSRWRENTASAHVVARAGAGRSARSASACMSRPTRCRCSMRSASARRRRRTP